MKRFHVHVAVHDLDQSVRFYSTLFGTAPAVKKDDYKGAALVREIALSYPFRFRHGEKRAPKLEGEKKDEKKSAVNPL